MAKTNGSAKTIKFTLDGREVEARTDETLWQVANRLGKERRSGRFNGRRNHTRRAYVCLKPGQEINFTEEAK